MLNLDEFSFKNENFYVVKIVINTPETRGVVRKHFKTF